MMKLRDDFMNIPVNEEIQVKEFILPGEKMKSLRNKAGLSVSKACKRMKDEYGTDLSVDSLNSYESGRRIPNIQTFFALCEIYGCNDISSYFNLTTNRKDQTHVILEDYNISQLADILIEHYKKEGSLELIQSMIQKLVH